MLERRVTALEDAQGVTTAAREPVSDEEIDQFITQLFRADALRFGDRGVVEIGPNGWGGWDGTSEYWLRSAAADWTADLTEAEELPSFLLLSSREFHKALALWANGDIRFCQGYRTQNYLYPWEFRTGQGRTFASQQLADSLTCSLRNLYRQAGQREKAEGYADLFELADWLRQLATVYTDSDQSADARRVDLVGYRRRLREQKAALRGYKAEQEDDNISYVRSQCVGADIERAKERIIALETIIFALERVENGEVNT